MELHKIMDITTNAIDEAIGVLFACIFLTEFKLVNILCLGIGQHNFIKDLRI